MLTLLYAVAINNSVEHSTRGTAMIDKETEAAPYVWFAKDDIEAKAAAAYNRHQAMFDSVTHQSRVALVKQICRKHFKGYSAIYETCRAQTKRRAANTEVKFAHIVKSKDFDRAALEKDLTTVGIATDMIINKVNTGSFSVHVA